MRTPSTIPNSTAIVVKETFTVDKSRVARLLALAFTEASDWNCRLSFGSAGQTGDPVSDPQRACEYVLSDAGGLLIVRKAGGREAFWVDSAAIQRGLDQIASKYPHLFAEFLNGGNNRGTANIFLHYCLKDNTPA